MSTLTWVPNNCWLLKNVDRKSPSKSKALWGDPMWMTSKRHSGNTCCIMIFSYSESRTGYAYLAVHEGVWLGIFAEPIGKLLLDNQRIKLLVFDRRAEAIMRWIP